MVKIHYTGKLENGKQFDSSVGGPPFECQIGVGQVIAGWDEGVCMMNKGSEATFTIPSEKGYGSQGAPPDIPPNATLIFTVQLLDFQAKQKPSQV